MVNDFIRYCQESYQELKLSSWLSRQQVVASTLVVIVLTTVVALYVAGIDWVLLKIVGLLFRMG